eukprot:TRINITY_DN2004_c0_g1_i1.p1 TRINITY_DN2004_c0_g1~~TRINITY_DN2004_c0_g1_i1.p1  ORF type:complete len:465 (+),score=52.37 TRINITY_DN2004_c0_g1_i1:83-1477(+)
MVWGRALPTSGFNRRQEGARFALLFGITLTALSLFDRVLVSVARGPVREELHLSNSEIAIPDTAYNTMYLIFGVLAGFAMDAGLNRRLILGGGLALWSVATSLTAFSSSLTWLVILQALVGIAEGAAHTTLVPFLAEFYPARERVLLFAILSACNSLGASLGFIMGGSLAGSLGWRLMYFLCGLPGIVVSASVLFLNDPAAGVNDQVVVNAEKTSSISGLLYGWFELVTYPQFMIAMAANTAHLFDAFHAYMPEYLTQNRGFSVAQAGIITGISVIGSIGGGPAGSKVVSIAEKSITNATFVVNASCLLADTIFGCLVINIHAGREVLLACLITYFFFKTTVIATAWTLSVNAVPVHLRGRAQGLWAMTAKLLGSTPSVLLFGAVADSHGLEATMQLSWLFILVPATLWLIGYFCTLPLRELAVGKSNKSAVPSDVDMETSFISFMYLEPPELSGDALEEYGTF